MNEQNNIPQVQEILIGCISPSPMNPRKTFNEDALRELAENIRQQGLLQPITVRHKTYMGDDGKVHRIENDFEIVCGERRYRACKMISDIMEIPCIVRDLSDDEAFDAMITENLQRKDIDPIEEAQAFTALRQRGQQVIDIATRFGRTYAYVSDRIRLAQLKEPLRLAVSAGRIPLRGGYLLARLNEDDQQAFIDDEYDEDCDYTISDIEEWLDRHFMNLWNAPFHDGESLQETWNPDGKLIRRCDACDCNTNNHGCLFADMKTEEPQCIDELCYNRKADIYYDWFLRQYGSRLVLAGKPATAGSVALFRDDCYFNDATKERIKAIADKFRSAGYRIFTAKELPNPVWSNIEGELADGTAIECIDISEMAGLWKIKRHVRRIPNAEPSRPATLPDGSTAGPTNYPDRLAERSATIEKTADKKVITYAKKNFDRDKYVSQKGDLQPWERTVLMAIVFDGLGYNDHKKLFPDAGWTPTFEQMERILHKTMFDSSWKRCAIAHFIQSPNHESYLEEAMKQLSIEANDFITKTRQKAEESIKDINDELRSMGYDENANKL